MSERRLATAGEVRLLRETTGMGMNKCKQAVEMAFDPALSFGGDILWAAFALDSGILAINVRGDRDAWNAQRGAAMAEDLRQRDSSINELYPVRNTAPEVEPDTLSARGLGQTMTR